MSEETRLPRYRYEAHGKGLPWPPAELEAKTDQLLAQPPPLEVMTAEEAEERRKKEPQIIQRVKGARYVIECLGPMRDEDRTETVRAFREWWDSDRPFVLARKPIRISMIVLPEVPFWVEAE